jgi:hypothetical protein
LRELGASGYEPVGGNRGPRRFARGARTEIVVPRARFRHRYGVRVEGARVVSERGAHVLVLRTCAHVRRVEIAVAKGIGAPSGCRVQA